MLLRAAEVLALQCWARQALFLQVAYAAVHMSGVALQQRDGVSQGMRGDECVADRQGPGRGKQAQRQCSGDG